MFCAVMEEEDLAFKYPLLRNKQEKEYSRKNKECKVKEVCCFFSYKVSSRAVLWLRACRQEGAGLVGHGCFSLEVLGAVASPLGQSWGRAARRVIRWGWRPSHLTLPEGQLMEDPSGTPRKKPPNWKSLLPITELKGLKLTCIFPGHSECFA